MTQEQLDLLAGALEFDGALPGLKSFVVECDWPTHGVPKLARALAGGTSPLLKHLSLRWGDDDDLDSLADMLEARASIPGCKGLESLDFPELDDWFDEVPSTTRFRLLRAMLPNVKRLPRLTWESEFELCFREVQAPYLTALSLWLDEEEEGQTVFSDNMLDSVPALVKIEVEVFGEHLLGVAVLRSLSSALRRGALRNLQEVCLVNCDLSSEDIGEFINVLEESGCAKRFVTLSLDNCGVQAEDLRALASAISRDAFPALKMLDFQSNTGIANVGVVALAEALSKAPEIFLTELNLRVVGMGDEGMIALASLVSQGCMQQMEKLGLSWNAGVTDRGVIALARAIETRGLPMLVSFRMGGMTRDKVTLLGFSAIAHAVINGCPQLKEIALKGLLNFDDDTLSNVVNGMVEAAGRAGNIKLR